MTSPSDHQEHIQERAAHRLQNPSPPSPPPPQPFPHPPTTRQQGTQRNTDDPFAPLDPQIHESSTQALNRKAARAAIPAHPPHWQGVPISQPPVAVGSAAIAALRQQADAVNFADIRAQAEVTRAAIPPPPPPCRQGVPIPQPPVVGSAAIAALRQQADAVNVADIRARAEAARAAIPPPPHQQGVPIPQPPPPQPPVAVGSAAIAALRQQANAANQQLMNTTVQRRQWENPRVPSLPALPPPPAPALCRPAMPPPLPDQLPPFDPCFAPLPPPQQQLLIDDRNHPDGFLARTPNQPHTPHLDIHIKTHYLGRMNA
ncbi:hypothetical protein M422DRAFT_262791 [Sphaerobolus stellatus SS14]|uniref:Uncharacterized protein n=1 Tax=Sphaerobolus stellatus (strain SS14) TaxID=990650 RepID=A0A0C9TX78_SPHS4|nr:hypothetical protein M422DRAFT_262791 [Sphaerobolus stellatus SS14]